MPRKVDNGALFIWCAPGRKVSSLHPITRDSTNVVKLINKASLLNVWCWQIFLLKSVHRSITEVSSMIDFHNFFLVSTLSLSLSLRCCQKWSREAEGTKYSFQSLDIDNVWYWLVVVATSGGSTKVRMVYWCICWVWPGDLWIIMTAHFNKVCRGHTHTRHTPGQRQHLAADKCRIKAVPVKHSCSLPTLASLVNAPAKFAKTKNFD